jgi:hypothetical protein
MNLMGTTIRRCDIELVNNTDVTADVLVASRVNLYVFLGRCAK